MAILNYGNQFKYSGKGYLDSKMAPVESVEDLETNVGVLSTMYMPGMKITVLNDGELGVVDYYLNDDYEWKRVVDLDKLALSFDKGDYDDDSETDYYLQLHYTNAKGELVALGDAIDLSLLLSDVEERVSQLENKPSTEDTNTYIEKGAIVTTKDDENGIFIEFSYNNGDTMYVDVTSLEPQTYSNGVGILIGNDNIININESWFEEWFELKISELVAKLGEIETKLDTKVEQSEYNERLAAIDTKLTNLSDNITEEVNSRKEEDGKLSQAINDEIAARIENIRELRDEMAAEVEIREAKDNELDGKISAMDTAYKAADEALQAAVDAKVAQSDYDTKVAELVAEDARIAGLVATEASAREAKDTELEGKIDAEVEAREALAEAYAETKEKVDFFFDTKKIEGTVDTLHEIATWLETNGGNGADIVADIAEETRLREEKDSELDDKIAVIQEEIKNLKPEGESFKIEIFLGDDEINAEDNN